MRPAASPSALPLGFSGLGHKQKTRSRRALLSVSNLDGTVDLVRSDASCANVCSSYCTVVVDSYSLNVGIPLSSSVSVRMGYTVSRNLSLSANLTFS